MLMMKVFLSHPKDIVEISSKNGRNQYSREPFIGGFPKIDHLGIDARIVLHPAESLENTSKCGNVRKYVPKVLTWKSMRKFFFS